MVEGQFKMQVKVVGILLRSFLHSFFFLIIFFWGGVEFVGKQVDSEECSTAVIM